ncbi:MAG: HAMP domain-containing sensor histidine kinase [Pseudomonadota bacterium]
MRRLLNTTSFRVAILNIVLFGAAVLILGWIVYNATFRNAERDTEALIDQEITLLAKLYATEGAGTLRTAIGQRTFWQDDSIYMLLGAQTGARLEGDLSSLPEKALEAGERLFEFEYDGRPIDATNPATQEANRKAVGKIVRFRPAEGEDPRFIIMVARDITIREVLRERLFDAMKIVGLAAIGLALILGAAFGSSLMRQVETINKTARAIRAGDLSQRIKLGNGGAELDELAQNLNDMLDQIERLMTGMKEVSDNIAHDLRSPLTRIRNRLTVALDSDGRAKDQELAATLDEAERMIATFNELLSIARIESGEVTGKKEPVNVAEIAEEVTELYEPAANDSGFVLKLTTKPVPLVNGSRALISQALANLLDNAMKYAEGGTCIDVTVRRDRNGNVFLGVADNGPGIPPEHHDHVLQRYARLEESRTTTGNGLGLSLVSAIARAHNAVLTLGATHPEREKRGLQVVIRFPRIPAMAKIAQNPAKT